MFALPTFDFDDERLVASDDHVVVGEDERACVDGAVRSGVRERRLAEDELGGETGLRRLEPALVVGVGVLDGHVVLEPLEGELECCSATTR